MSSRTDGEEGGMHLYTTGGRAVDEARVLGGDALKTLVSTPRAGASVASTSGPP